MVLLHAVWSAIVMILSSVCLSVCLSVRLWRRVLWCSGPRGRWWGYDRLKLGEHRVCGYYERIDSRLTAWRDVITSRDVISAIRLLGKSICCSSSTALLPGEGRGGRRSAPTHVDSFQNCSPRVPLCQQYITYRSRLHNTVQQFPHFTQAIVFFRQNLLLHRITVSVLACSQSSVTGSS